MNSFNEIYIRNLKLDKAFNQKYLSEELIFEKNCLELIAELGELMNETKIFKYWSIKKPDKEEVLEEYADCVIMTLYFYGYLNLELTKFNEPKDLNAMEMFNYLFFQSSKLMNEINEDLVKDIFTNLLDLGKKLGFDEMEIIKACQHKQNKVEKRLSEIY